MQHSHCLTYLRMCLHQTFSGIVSAKMGGLLVKDRKSHQALSAGMCRCLTSFSSLVALLQTYHTQHRKPHCYTVKSALLHCSK
jgi:hypothetical protein